MMPEDVFDRLTLEGFRDPQVRDEMCARKKFEFIGDTLEDGELVPVFECLRCNGRFVHPEWHNCRKEQYRREKNV